MLPLGRLVPVTVVTRLRAKYDVVAREAAKFGAVGAISYLIDLTVFNLVLHLFEDKPLTAKVVSTVVAGLNAYLLNRHWSFRHRERQSVRPSCALFDVGGRPEDSCQILPIS
jgi:putative flippase GtrA